MSVDTTFKPISPTVPFGTTGGAVALVDKGAYLGVTTFRIRCVTAGYIAWGSTASLAAPSATPAVGVQLVNTLGFATGQTGYFEIPAASFFRGDGTGVFEVTPGSGGTGG